MAGGIDKGTTPRPARDESSRPGEPWSGGDAMVEASAAEAAVGPIAESLLAMPALVKTVSSEHWLVTGAKRTVNGVMLALKGSVDAAEEDVIWTPAPRDEAELEEGTAFFAVVAKRFVGHTFTNAAGQTVKVVGTAANRLGVNAVVISPAGQSTHSHRTAERRLHQFLEEFGLVKRPSAGPSSSRRVSAGASSSRQGEGPTEEVDWTGLSDVAAAASLVGLVPEGAPCKVSLSVAEGFFSGVCGEEVKGILSVESFAVKLNGGKTI